MEPAKYNALLIAMGQDPRFKPSGSYRIDNKESTLFLLSPGAPGSAGDPALR